MSGAAPDGAGDVALITFSADAESLNFVCANAPPSAAHDEKRFRSLSRWRLNSAVGPEDCTHLHEENDC
jgi:hypothetical protein